MSSSKRTVRIKNTPRSSTTSFRCTDIVVNNAGDPTTVPTLWAADSTGLVENVLVFSPLGISVPGFTTTSGIVAISPSVYEFAKLPWLFNSARNFGSFRVRSATLVLAGNVASTTPGRVAIYSTTDPVDFSNGVHYSWGSGKRGQQFSLASLADRSKRVPLNVDSSWKKVTSTTYELGSAHDGASNVLASSAGISGLAFTSVAFCVVGAPASASLFTASLELDVEFKDPVSFFTNI